MAKDLSESQNLVTNILNVPEVRVISGLPDIPKKQKISKLYKSYLAKIFIYSVSKIATHNKKNKNKQKNSKLSQSRSFTPAKKESLAKSCPHNVAPQNGKNQKKMSGKSFLQKKVSNFWHWKFAEKWPLLRSEVQIWKVEIARTYEKCMKWHPSWKIFWFFWLGPEKKRVWKAFEKAVFLKGKEKCSFKKVDGQKKEGLNINQTGRVGCKNGKKNNFQHYFFYFFLLQMRFSWLAFHFLVTQILWHV